MTIAANMKSKPMGTRQSSLLGKRGSSIYGERHLYSCEGDFQNDLGETCEEVDYSQLDAMRRHARDLSRLELEKTRTLAQSEKIENLYFELSNLSSILRDTEAARIEASDKAKSLAKNLAHEREAFRRERDELLRLLGEMRTSTSWKISSPLRVVGNFVRRWL